MNCSTVCGDLTEGMIMGRKMGVLIVAAAGLLAAGCQEERAYVAADDYMALSSATAGEVG